MVFKAALTFSLLGLSLFASAGPLQQREALLDILEVELGGSFNEIGQLVQDIIGGSKPATDNNQKPKPSKCDQSKDKCCVWYDVSAELTKLFVGKDKQCNDNARAAVRMGFHDAGSWDQSSSHGGADGSLIMDFGEHDRRENNGLQSVRTLLRGVRDKYKVGAADLVQYAHNHATVSCPKGPRVRTFVGRLDATKANPKGLLPDTHDNPDNLIALFKRKGISERELAALVGAHATARQRFVDTSPAAVNKPLDSTPGVWDVEFYNDTLNNPIGATAEQKVFVLPSDKALSQHPKTSGDWRRFVGNQGGWNADYARAYIKVSLFGVKQEQLAKMVDCTQTLPLSRDIFP
ncbi:class II peroxidase [Bipolaris victoriae FI3]|uniref:Peroxidase n=2 Tax=Bipolaris TaxID=33194 RepID=W6XYG8_COCC2|nr:class II peroxidase [Bipolaris zeicola 26-R-13]XP_014552468.1 class II peroxidase [Bipolaris victoriae FI3]EUC30763.1 class II peroxidase [Bipolaris zeicola 26-R-13]